MAPFFTVREPAIAHPAPRDQARLVVGMLSDAQLHAVFGTFDRERAATVLAEGRAAALAHPLPDAVGAADRVSAADALSRSIRGWRTIERVFAVAFYVSAGAFMLFGIVATLLVWFAPRSVSDQLGPILLVPMVTGLVLAPSLYPVWQVALVQDRRHVRRILIEWACGRTGQLARGIPLLRFPPLTVPVEMERFLIGLPLFLVLVAVCALLMPLGVLPPWTLALGIPIAVVAIVLAVVFFRLPKKLEKRLKSERILAYALAGAYAPDFPLIVRSPQ